LNFNYLNQRLVTAYCFREVFKKACSLVLAFINQILFIWIHVMNHGVTASRKRRFTVAEWITHLAATLEVMGLRPSLGDILKIYFSNRYSLCSTEGLT